LRQFIQNKNKTKQNKTKKTRGQVMIRKTIFTIGLNDKNTLSQIIPLQKAQNIVLDIVLGYYEGLTMNQGWGVYKMASGESVYEMNLQVIVYFSDSESDLAIVEKLKQALNQESIAVESGLVDSQLL
jgi:hypothetical protein